jgi:hypothetical protein
MKFPNNDFEIDPQSSKRLKWETYKCDNCKFLFNRLFFYLFIKFKADDVGEESSA